MSVGSLLSCARHGVAESQQHFQCDCQLREKADKDEVHVSATRWGPGALTPTFRKEHGEEEEPLMEELTAEVSEPMAADRTAPVMPPPHLGDEHDRECEHAGRRLE